MTHSFAPAKVAYRELREAIGPWAKANGFRRWPGTQAGWQRAVDLDQALKFNFEGHSMVSPDLGNAWYGLVQLEAASNAASILRQSPFSCCLVQAELDEIARIQGVINRRRPPLPPDLQAQSGEDRLLGHHLRELHHPQPVYREGQVLHFGFYSLQDVREIAGFIARALPHALDRFREGRAAKPIDDTPPHLRPTWLAKGGL